MKAAPLSQPCPLVQGPWHLGDGFGAPFPPEKETMQGRNGSNTEGILGISYVTSQCPAFNVHSLMQSSQHSMNRYY